MNRMNSKPKSLQDMISEECFLSISDLNTEHTKKYISDEEQRKKTVRLMLENMIKEKTKSK